MHMPVWKVQGLLACAFSGTAKATANETSGHSPIMKPSLCNYSFFRKCAGGALAEALYSSLRNICSGKDSDVCTRVSGGPIPHPFELSNIPVGNGLRRSSKFSREEETNP